MYDYLVAIVVIGIISLIFNLSGIFINPATAFFHSSKSYGQSLAKIWFVFKPLTFPLPLQPSTLQFQSVFLAKSKKKLS